MNIKIFPSGPFVTNAYIISCPNTLTAAIIDPAPESKEAIIRTIEAEGLKPEKILLTHSHWDHIVDTAPLKKRYQIPVYIHELDERNLSHPGSDGLPLFDAMESVEADHFFNEGDEISVGEITLKVIHTPGHTPGGVCFFDEKEHILISGDTLFCGSIGNISFPTADPEAMWASLKKLSTLPADTIVYPGHGPSTVIGKETWLPRAKEIFG